MTGSDSDDERDERIRNEIIVDAYTPDEQAISCCYYQIAPNPSCFINSATRSGC